MFFMTCEVKTTPVQEIKARGEGKLKCRHLFLHLSGKGIDYTIFHYHIIYICH